VKVEEEEERGREKDEREKERESIFVFEFFPPITTHTVFSPIPPVSNTHTSRTTYKTTRQREGEKVRPQCSS
jgi:hypothetical protein